MTKHLTGVPPVTTTHTRASSFKKVGGPEPGSWNRVCVKFQQLIARSISIATPHCTASESSWPWLVQLFLICRPSLMFNAVFCLLVYAHDGIAKSFLEHNKATTLA